LKYVFLHISMYHLSLYFETTAQIPEVEFGGKYGYMRANMDIWGQINDTFIFIGYWTWRLYTFETWINIGQTRRLQWSIFLLVFWRQYRKRNADTYHSIIYIFITYFVAIWSHRFYSVLYSCFVKQICPFMLHRDGRGYCLKEIVNMTIIL
jgi:hypothetical protein